MRLIISLAVAVQLCFLLVLPSLADSKFPGRGSYQDWAAAGIDYNRASELMHAGDLTGAITLYKRANERYALSSDYHANYGVALQKAGRYLDAETEYEKSLQLHPAWDVYENLAGCYFSTKQFGDAKSAAIKALTLQPPAPARQRLEAAIKIVDSMKVKTH
jgi:tetratricopeptide (TPR) repeat protein